MTDLQLRERIIHDIESLQLGQCQKRCSLNERMKKMENEYKDNQNVIRFIYNRLLNVHYEDEGQEFMRKLRGMLK